MGMTPLSSQALAVADALVHHLRGLAGTGAKPADLVMGYRAAADRVAAWAGHGSWPRLRDGE